MVFFPSRDWSMICIANEGNFVVKIDKDQGLYHSFFGKIESYFMDLVGKTVDIFFGKNHNKTTTVLGF
jgi:hypothetical protein